MAACFIKSKDRKKLRKRESKREREREGESLTDLVTGWQLERYVM